MLEYLRKANEKPLAKFLMGILMFSFVGWGVAEWIFNQSRDDDYILKIGKVPLTVNAFNMEKNRAMAGLDKAAQKQLYTEPAMGKLFAQQVLAGQISRVMLEMRGQDSGLVVSDSAIASVVRNAPEFQDNGRFSPEKFDYALMSAGLSEAGYTEFARYEMLRQMASAGIVAPIVAPKFMAVAEYDARYASRKISFTKIAFDEFKVSGDPTDDQLKAVYAQNQKIVPEKREVSYVLLPVKMDAPDAYDKGYTDAQKLEDALIGGETMSAAAKRFNGKYVNAIADEKSKDEIIARNHSKLLQMDQGIESEIIETKSGFVIFRIEKIDPAHAAPFESVKDEMVALWKKEEQKKQAYVRANELLSAEKFGSAATITRANGAPLAVLNAAFANPVGTKTIVPDANAFFVMNISEEIMPTPDAAKLASMHTENQKMLVRMISDDYTAFLAREYPVKINEKVYRRMIGE